MRAAHAHLPVTDVDFDRFLGYLAEILAELEVVPARTAEVLDALEPLRAEIVSAHDDSPDDWGSTDPSGGSG